MNDKDARKFIKRDERMRELYGPLEQGDVPLLRRTRAARLITAYNKWLWDITTQHVSVYLSDSEPHRI